MNHSKCKRKTGTYKHCNIPGYPSSGPRGC